MAIVIWAGPVLFALATLGFLAADGLWYLRSVPVNGTVAELHERPGETLFDAGVTNYEPIFTYQLGGETRRASIGPAHGASDLAVGETAPIRALPGGTGDVRMDTWRGLWFIPAMLALFTLGFTIVALPTWAALDRFVFGKGRT
ncbi:hypothetical protein [Wenxinia saemankumensis]|uniref:DUF3592 domain-containing protein n=1 Tax=Wenxinia saemankumensis TaxID=1447782 RepID=A0A1M6AVR7_9RHOB|nr:hypothetical protein [Wenxinia saemankumensis]SHI40566.1 hypothetical protein SAMN05444417_0650 [Wenxinia saemankumensis]